MALRGWLNGGGEGIEPKGSCVTFVSLRRSTTSDSPWTHLVDQERYHLVLEGVRTLQPSQIFSSHLPAASGASLISSSRS